VQSLVAVGARELAGIAAGWYFGGNAAGVATYDPATGRTYDGVSGDGVVNRNSGAESTIHGLLSMLALDADPALAGMARDAAQVRHRESTVLVEGESATGGEVVTPSSAWTGESQWSGGAYLRGGDGTVARWQVPAADQPRLVAPIVNRLPGAGTTSWSADRPLGTVDHNGGRQGVSPAPGALLPVTLPAPLRPTATAVTARSTGESAVDGLLLRPEVSQVVYGNTALLQNAANGPRVRPVTVSTTGHVTVLSYDGRGRLLHRTTASGPNLRTPVAKGGYTVLRW
jgi:YD repeat-containing protein